MWMVNLIVWEGKKKTRERDACALSVETPNYPNFFSQIKDYVEMISINKVRHVESLTL